MQRSLLVFPVGRRLTIDDSANSLQGCDVVQPGELDPGRHIVLVPKSHDDVLTDKQRVDYSAYREQFLTWLSKVGKNEDKAEGYSPYTVYATISKWGWVTQLRSTLFSTLAVRRRGSRRWSRMAGGASRVSNRFNDQTPLWKSPIVESIGVLNREDGFSTIVE